MLLCCEGVSSCSFDDAHKDMQVACKISWAYARRRETGLEVMFSSQTPCTCCTQDGANSDRLLICSVLPCSGARIMPAEIPVWQDSAVPEGLYPVSIEWDPPFTMLVDLIGHGDRQAGVDTSAVLSIWGTWQPAMAPTRGPTVADALIGSLGGRGAERRVSLPSIINACYGTKLEALW